MKKDFKNQKDRIPSAYSLANQDKTLRSDLRYETYCLKRIDRAMQKTRDMAKSVNDVYHYNQTLKHLGSSRFLRREHIDEIFSLLEKRKVKLTIHTFVLAMSALQRTGDYVASLEYFDKLLLQHTAGKIKTVNTVAITAAIRSACLAHDFQRAVLIFRSMESEYNCQPNCRTYQTLLRYFSQFWYDDSCADIVAEGLESDSVYTWEYCALLFARLGRFDDLRKFFERDREYSPTTYYVGAIAFYLHGEDRKRARKLRKKAKSTEQTEKRADANQTPDDTGEKDGFYGYIEEQWKNLAAMARQYAPRTEYTSAHSNSCFLEGRSSVDQWKRLKHPISLEIGCGSGDWLVSQASQSTTHWVGMDLRSDRLWQSWTKAVFQEVDRRMTFIGGDARASLESCPENFFENVYVNFPEPPNFYDDPNRFYNVSMLQRIYDILEPNGNLFFLTDDARQAIDIVTQITDNKIQFTIHYQNGKPWASKPPQSYAESFFDEFWKRGCQSSRYFVTLQKCAVEEHQ